MTTKQKTKTAPQQQKAKAKKPAEKIKVIDFCGKNNNLVFTLDNEVEVFSGKDFTADNLHGKDVLAILGLLQKEGVARSHALAWINKARAFAERAEKARQKFAKENAFDDNEEDGPYRIKNKTHVMVALEIAHDLGTFFKDQFGDSYITANIGGHNEILALHSRPFKSLLAGTFYKFLKGMTLSPQDLATAILTLESEAQFNAPQYELSNRVCWHNGTICYDMTDKLWRSIIISKDGWQVVANTPIPMFKRYSHQTSQETPTTAENLDSFINLFNFSTEGHKTLIKVWLVSAFIPDMPHPLLVLFWGPGRQQKFFL